MEEKATKFQDKVQTNKQIRFVNIRHLGTEKNYSQRTERKDMFVVFIRQQYVISVGNGIIYIMINHAPRKLSRKGL